MGMIKAAIVSTQLQTRNLSNDSDASGIEERAATKCEHTVTMAQVKKLRRTPPVAHRVAD